MCGTNISTIKMKLMPFNGRYPVRNKMVICVIIL